MDVLREIGAEIEGFHSMLEASLIAGQLTDLRIIEGDQYLLYLRNLPDKVAEFVQLHCSATTVARVWESVVAYHTRMKLTNDLDSKVPVATGPKQGSEGITCHNCGKRGHTQPVKCSHCGKSGHAAKDCWAKDPSKRPGASSTPKPVAKAKVKPAAKSKGSKGRGKGGKFREVEEGEEPAEAEESQEPEGEPHRFWEVGQALHCELWVSWSICKLEGCRRQWSSFECDLNLRPFGNWLEDSPWQCWGEWIVFEEIEISFEFLREHGGWKSVCFQNTRVVWRVLDQHR